MFAIPIPTVSAFPASCQGLPEAELPEQPQPEQSLLGEWLRSLSAGGAGSSPVVSESLGLVSASAGI